jgi:geranyl-CoA carboxylase beta subunit
MCQGIGSFSSGVITGDKAYLGFAHVDCASSDAHDKDRGPHMNAIQSSVDATSAEFVGNAASLLQIVDAMRAIQQRVVDKSFESQPKFTKLGKILPHARVRLLLDAGAPFIELCGLAGYMRHDDKDGSDAGGGIIAGIGFVSGARCLVMASNSAIKGGTVSPAGLEKTLRLQQIALQSKLPLIALTESGGANLSRVGEIFAHGGRGFANQARLSAAGIPMVTVVHGNATAGGAYQPGLSDYVIAVRKQTAMFLAGPPLLLAATGEVATEEDLGGAEMHTQVAGSAEYLAENDVDGIRIARDIVAMLNWKETAPNIQREVVEPLYSAEELLGLVPNDPKKPFDMKEVIARLVDGSKFLEFKSEFDNQTVCGWAHIGGFTVGIITNNGPITAQGAAKTAQFIQLCDQTKRPLLFLHNTTGFMVGTESEQLGVIKHGAKFIQAVANARVPKISLVVGSSYGAGNYAMCGRGLDPHFIFAWPNSHTAVMGGPQAGKVLRIVTEEKQRKAGIVSTPESLDFIELSTAAMMDQQSTALFGTAHLFDDGLIDPRDSRRLLVFLLQTIAEAEGRALQPNSFGVARF